MRRHRLDRRQRKKRRKIIIFSMIGIVFLFSIGYATFNQNFLVSGKGTIIEKPWRIMSIENDNTLKIIRDESIGDIPWDLAGVRDSSINTYCARDSDYGCNAWAATANLVGNPKDFVLHYPNGNPNEDTTTYYGNVVADSSLNIYLNTTYYQTLGEDKQYIVNHNFNVGTPGYVSDTEDIGTDITQEALYKWNGKIGLMTATEILRTTSGISCTSLKVGNNDYQKSVCSEANWIWPKSGYMFTISPCVTSACSVIWFVNSEGYIHDGHANHTRRGILPVVHLRSDITLAGHGTDNNPYTIVNN